MTRRIQTMRIGRPSELHKIGALGIRTGYFGSRVASDEQLFATREERDRAYEELRAIHDLGVRRWKGARR